MDFQKVLVFFINFMKLIKFGFLLSNVLIN